MPREFPPLRFRALLLLVSLVLLASPGLFTRLGFRGAAGAAVAQEQVPVAAEEADQPSAEPAAAAPKRTVVIPVHGMIEPGLLGFLERRFAEAEEAGAEVIVLDIDSPGGRLDTTFEIIELIREAEDIEVVAYIRRMALSGAAMTALATDRIEMHPEAQMGDVGVIIGGPFSAFQYVEEKERSPVVALIRTLAEATGRPPALAEAMVDKDITVYSATHQEDGRQAYFTDKEWDSLADREGWVQGPPVFESRENNFLTVNGSRAVALGLAEATSRSLEETFDHIDAQRPVTVLAWTWIDTTIDWLNSGWMAALLILVGLIALGVELAAPGLGIGGLVSLLCFSLFFWSRFLGGTAGWLEVILFVSALAFIAAEVFVFPGFGVAGITGIGLLVFSLVMASRRVLLPQTGADWVDLGTALLAVCAALIGVMVVAFFAADTMTNLPFFRRFVLEPPQFADSPRTGTGTGIPGVEGEKKSLAMLPAWQRVAVGDLGVTVSTLRPSGKAQFAEDIVDVATEGEFLDVDVAVRVIKKQGLRLTVRAV